MHNKLGIIAALVIGLFAGSSKAQTVEDLSPELITPPDTAELFSSIKQDGRPLNCDVEFDLTVDGVPENIRANCNYSDVDELVLDAIGSSRYAPVTLDGKPVRFTDLSWPIKYDPTAVITSADREAQPITPPDQVPLVKAIRMIGKPAKCVVKLDVDPEGKPINIVSFCTVDRYNKSVVKAMKEARFAPKIVDGQAVERTGVVYPIELFVEDSSGPPKLPKCGKQRTSRKEIRQLEDFRDAVYLQDYVLADQLLSKIRRDKLFCAHVGMLDLYLVRQHILKNEWSEAEALLDRIEKYSDSRINDTVTFSYKNLHKQWFDDLKSIQSGNAVQDRDAKSLLPACMKTIYDAHKKHKVKETCGLSFGLDEKGVLTDVQATCENPDYVTPAQSAARCMAFLPRIKDGQAVAVPKVTAEVTFEAQPKQ